MKNQIDWGYLKASQQLQLDKQNYGDDYIHLYVDNIEGNWLENWSWDDSFDSNDYAAAFIHQIVKGKVKAAVNIIIAWFTQL